MDRIIAIEDAVKNVREAGQISTLSIERKGLAHSIVYNIENHGNYAVRNLFKYMDLIGLRLSVNDVAINNMEELGAFLRDKREKEKLTLRLMEGKTSLYNTQIIDIEKGRGYTKNTLLKYINAFEDIDFKLCKC